MPAQSTPCGYCGCPLPAWPASCHCSPDTLGAIMRAPMVPSDDPAYELRPVYPLSVTLAAEYRRAAASCPTATRNLTIPAMYRHARPEVRAMSHDTTPATSPYDRAIAYATAEGTRAGKAAASWYFDGNTPAEAYRKVLQGLETGDPAIFDTLPQPDLSGEWADTLTGPELVEDACAAAGIVADDDGMPDWFSDICDAYEAAFSDAAQAQIERVKFP